MQPAPAGEQATLRAHGFHRLAVRRVVVETPDARSFVLEVPPDLAELFRYRAGQFCTFRVTVGGEEHLRSYSMSSAPSTDAELVVTVKRVEGGAVSSWLLDNIAAGDVLEVTPPAGVFCLGEGRAERPLVGLCGGSGVTPVMSLAKTALATSDRPVRILYANRSAASVIFEAQLEALAGRYPDRLVVRHHLDTDSGYLGEAAVRAFLTGAEDGDFYICGPQAFMDLVEQTLLTAKVPAERIFIERFGTPPPPAASLAPATPASSARVPDTVTVIMKGKKTTVTYQPGDTLLETARRGKLNPPFSCESGTCATCMAVLREGAATMRVNHALTTEEVEEGWVLTCQAVPEGTDVTVEYESY